MGFIQMRLVISSLVLIIAASASTVAQTKRKSPHAQQIKKGDVLSKIVYDHFGLPLYGSHGNLEKVLEINPEIKNRDLVYPAQWVRLKKTKKTKKTSTPPAATLKTENQPREVKSQIAEPGIKKRYSFEWGAELSFYLQRDEDITPGRSRGKASFRSYPSPGLFFSGIWEWQKWGRSKVGANVHFLRWASFPRLDFEGAFQILPEFWVGHEYRSFTLSGGMRSTMYSHALSSSRISLDSVWIPYLAVSYLFSFANTKFSLEPKAEFLFPSSNSAYEINSGWAGSLKLAYDFSSCELFFRSRMGLQNSSITEQNEISATLGVAWRIKP